MASVHGWPGILSHPAGGEQALGTPAPGQRKLLFEEERVRVEETEPSEEVDGEESREAIEAVCAWPWLPTCRRTDVGRAPMAGAPGRAGAICAHARAVERATSSTCESLALLAMFTCSI